MFSNLKQLFAFKRLYIFFFSIVDNMMFMLIPSVMLFTKHILDLAQGQGIPSEDRTRYLVVIGLRELLANHDTKYIDTEQYETWCPKLQACKIRKSR